VKAGSECWCAARHGARCHLNQTHAPKSQTRHTDLNPLAPQPNARTNTASESLTYRSGGAALTPQPHAHTNTTPKSQTRHTNESASAP